MRYLRWRWEDGGRLELWRVCGDNGEVEVKL